MAYLDEIALDSGKHPFRKEPVLAAEQYYDRLLLKTLKGKKCAKRS